MRRRRFWANAFWLTAIVATVLALGSSASAASEFKIVHSFDCVPEGCGSNAGLTFDAKRDLYGTTGSGGSGDCNLGCGTIFRLTPPSGGGPWTLSVLHNLNLSEGDAPFAGVTLDQSGNLYGTASGGGAYQYGTVFELTPSSGGWTLNVLHSFDLYGGDGADPFAGVLLDEAGSVYGTTQDGGVYGGEVVFKLKPGSNGKWSERMLHNFGRSTGHDGGDPEAGLIWDSTGNLYGTTRWGGGHYKSCTVGCGVVFNLSPTSGGSWKEQPLHQFNWHPGGPDGYGPYAPVVFNAAGNLYGTTAAGGSSNGCQDGCGTVFKLAPSSSGPWKETILYSFGPGNGGSAPFAGVVLDKAGDLYGTTQRGGINNAGVVFKRQASAYLTQQFAKLWKQKEVRFDIEIDATTLNVFVEDVGLGMPVRLSRRSTGFRWYVSFAWKFTHATRGDYKNCILLLEEPGIHLHHAGHRDLLDLFDRLAADNNTVIYTTHLSTMLDQGYPERIRIVEVRDHHSRVVNGMVSDQKKPMMVIEARLGLSGEMSGLLGNRQTLIVEGGDDALILQKLSGVLRKAGREGLSDRIYPMPADGASKTPMYAGFLIGQGWDAAVLLDSDGAGEKARKKIKELYLDQLAKESKFRVFMLGPAAGITTQNESAIEDIFPRDFYLDCVNAAYGISIREADLPVDGSSLIADRVEQVLQQKHGRAKLDTALVMKELLKRFDGWDDISKLPAGLADRAEKLFAAINAGFK
jgi:uncharacterized repeat protein (TIGR03803 family)